MRRKKMDKVVNHILQKVGDGSTISGKVCQYFFTLTSFLMEQHDYNCLVCSKGETGKSRHKCIFLVEYLYLC